MAAVKEKLTNLKICIDNEEADSDDELSLTDEPEVSVEDGLSEREVKRKPDEDEPVSPMSEHGTDEVQFNVYLEKLPEPASQTKVQPSRVYGNKTGDFVTGIDFNNKEERQKREERAKRFGIPLEEKPEVDFYGLYESLGLKLEDLERRDERGIRLEAIHFRGVSDMNTKDVFNYFQEFAAGGVEWIDDDSCNVVWMDKVTAARAMLKLSRSYDQVMRERGLLPDVIPSKVKPQNRSSMEVDTEPKQAEDPGDSTEANKDERTEEKMEEDDDNLDLTEDKQDDKITETKTSENKEEEKKEEQMDKEDGELSEEGEIKDSEDEMGDDDRDLRNNIKRGREIPWPPGKWRLGVACPGKAEYLFLRFATKADVKLPGAERRSKFYQKYGNPNYGGMRGLISNSRKRKLRSYQPREGTANISEQGTASVADRNQVSYDGFDIFSDALGPLEEEEMGLYPSLKKDKNKKKQDEKSSEKDSGEEMQSDYENQYPIFEKVAHKFGNSDGISDDSEESGVDERELEQLLGQAAKRPAMKMYADEIEEQQTAKRTRQAVGALTIVADAKKKLKHVKDARQLIAGLDLRSALQEKSQSKANSFHYSRDKDSLSRSRSPSPIDMRDRLDLVPSPIHRTIENSPPRAVKRFSPIRIESTLEKSPSPIQRSPSPVDVRAVKSKDAETVRSRSPSGSSVSLSPSPPPRPVDARNKIKDARAKINEARAKKVGHSRSPRGVMRSDLPQKQIRSPPDLRKRSRSPFGGRRRSRSPFRPRQNLRRSRSRSPMNWLDRLDSGARPRYRRSRSRSPIRNRPRWQRQRPRSRSRSPVNRRRSPVHRPPIRDRTRSGRDARSRLSKKSRSPADTESESEEEDIAPSRIRMTVDASSSSSSSSEDSSSSSSDSSSSDSSSSSSSDSDSESSSDSNNSVSPAPRRRPNKDRAAKNTEKTRKSPRRQTQETARKRTGENMRKKPQERSGKRTQERSKHSSMRKQMRNGDS